MKITTYQLANYLKPWIKGYGDANRINALTVADNILRMYIPESKPDMRGQVKQVIAIAQEHYPLAANWMINMSGKTFSKKDGNK